MQANQSPSFDQHEQVAFIDDAASGLKAIIAVHNTHLGPAVGGCRMFPYLSDAAALEDVLRLSRGMTYKSALAGLKMGGGKAVIIGDPATQKTPQLFAKMGEFVDSLNGKYVSAEDSGTCVADLKLMAKETNHVLGINDEQEFGGDPSPLTAYGIFCGIQASLQHKFGSSNLQGRQVTVQGAGAVGRYLIKLLIEAGASVKACDLNASNLDKAVELGAQIIDVDKVISTAADVFAPCAMGAIINDLSIKQLAAPIVAGGANNQLARAEHAEMLRQRGVLYAPDFVINAGGIIEIARQFENASIDQTRVQIENISNTLSNIFQESDRQGCATNVVAEQLAEAKFMPHEQNLASHA